jgi:hypothetical protein
VPPALKALLAQSAGAIIAIAIARGGFLPAGIWPVAATQAAGAAVVAAALRSDRWWLPIHLGFVPLLVGAGKLDVAPGWYLLGFAVLLAVYWSSFRTQVPLYLSSRKTADAVAALVPTGRLQRALDVGSGTASVLRRLAKARPDCVFEGIEVAPAPWLLSKLLARAQPNLRLRRGDFFSQSWRGFDVVYAFLSPVPMARVWEKAGRELPAGAILISNSFPVPGAVPERTVEVGDTQGTVLYVYRVMETGSTTK